MWLQSKIEIGEPVYILWWEPVGFINIEAVFAGLDSSDLIFHIDGKTIKGSQCFWIQKSKITSLNQLLFFQKAILPVQLKLYEYSLKTNQEFVPKLKSSEIERMMKAIKQKHDQVKNIIDKYGFDPSDTTWVEELMPETNLERDWYSFLREFKDTFVTIEQVKIFNARFGYSLDLDTAKTLLKKRMRYLIGAFTLRWSGEKDKEKWRASACSFESKFSSCEQAMINWYLSKNGEPQLVIVKEPIQFYAGQWFLKIIERIPNLFTNYECKYIKPGVALEVFGFDRENKYIDLDFTADIRKKIFDTEDRHSENTYAILLKNVDVANKLESIEHL